MKTLYQKALELEELLGDKKRWLKQALARDALGQAVHPARSYACKFCLVGAIAHVENVSPVRNTYDEVARSDLGHLIKMTIYGIEGQYHRGLNIRSASKDVYNFNDAYGRTHAQVMEVVHTAVAFAKGAE